MIEIQRSDERGAADHGWLKTRYSFSFADYHNPDRMGFGPLRVLNEDYIQGKQGFGQHPHADMEIVTILLEGQIAHEDTGGGKGILRAGDVQYMCAGTGVRHSEMNPGPGTTHLLQIWIQPPKKGLPVRYDQKSFSIKKNELAPIVSPSGPLKMHQDASFFLGHFEKGKKFHHANKKGRGCYLFLIDGSLSVNSSILKKGDAASITESVDVVCTNPARFVMIDLLL